MSLWRRIRAEAAGAWRSLRYDLGRRPDEAPAGGPDMTSTGMNTFGGHSMVMPAGLGDPVQAGGPRRAPRRALAISALGLLTVVGATAAYLAVANGLMSALSDQPAAAGTLAPAPAPADAAIGSGPAARRKPTARTVPASPAAPTTGAPQLGGSAGALVPHRTGPVRTVKPTNPECACNVPPVPTPTAPTASPSPTPSSSDPASADPSPTGSPADSDQSPEPSGSPEGRHRRHRY